MTNDEKAKAYEMALEAARKELGVDRKEWEVVQRVLHNIFPELRESEDERIRKELIEYLKGDLDDITTDDTDRWINWIEKQKDCFLVPKSHIDPIGLPGVDGMELLEKQKESLHISESCKENTDSFTDEDERIRQLLVERVKTATDWSVELRDLLLNYLEKQKNIVATQFSLGEQAGKEDVLYELEKRKDMTEALRMEYEKGRADAIEERKINDPFYEAKFREGYELGYEDAMRVNKPVELSEDIKRTLDDVSRLLIMLNYKEMARNYKQAIEQLISMLPQKKEDLPKWKPSEEQMSALRTAIGDEKEAGSDVAKYLRELYEQLKAL